MEDIRPVAGLAQYEVAKDGTVYRSGAVVKPFFCNGYLAINVLEIGKQMKVHRLVAFAFLGPPPTALHHVNHLDGNRANPHADNLEWATQAENMQHAFRVLGHKNRGEGHFRTTLTEEQVKKIAKDKRKLREIAAEYDVSLSTISKIRLGQTWKYSLGDRSSIN